MNLSENKRCSKCKNYYPASCFRKNRCNPDGLSGWCKICSRQVDRGYYHNNREKILKAQQEYRQVNLEHCRKIGRKSSRKRKEDQKKYLKSYYINNKNKFKNKSKQYYQEHKEEIKEKVRQYSKNNPKKIQVQTQNKRARKFGLGDKIATQEWIDLLDFYGHRCLKCGTTDVKLTQDHVIPLTKGGRNLISNIQPLCVSCNSSKHTDIVDYRTEFH